MAESRPRLGRPRDATINDRALTAARELLVELGFDATTVQAIAERAGVHASAIYRRWPSRIALIAEAMFPGLSPLSVRPTGDLHHDLRRFVGAYLEVFGAPAARAAAAGMLAHYQTSSATLPTELVMRISARPQFIDILRAAPPGTVDPELDPDDVFDMLLGTLITRVLLQGAVARAAPAERIAEMIARLLRPATDGPAPERSPAGSAG
jgi:AcrR family transcriptional regulator